MASAKSKKSTKPQKPAIPDPLDTLLAAASQEMLSALITQLAFERHEVRRECLEYLKTCVSLPPGESETTEAEVILAMWGELEPDLAELDEYGGGDYDTEDHVASLLYEMAEKLNQTPIPTPYRQAVMDEALPYLRSGNAGLDDALYALVDAICQDDSDCLRLAEQLETIERWGARAHARCIYREIGHSEKYLALRLMDMQTGMDYYDLATFYWETGDKQQALTVAEEGLESAIGRMDELRTFLADRAAESGDREKLLALQFDNTLDNLSLTTYKAFKRFCRRAEWAVYEPRLYQAMILNGSTEALKILLHRQEYDIAIDVLTHNHRPQHITFEGEVTKIAKTLEAHYPTELLAWYQSGLGALNRSASRKDYQRSAALMKKVRHLYVNVLKAPTDWQQFAKPIKLRNARRPAFQEEYATTVPGWGKL